MRVHFSYRIAPPAVAVVLAMGLQSQSSAFAAACSEQLVQARGEPSTFEVWAKAKARGNWRAKVRSIPALGPLYANWSKAAEPAYACVESSGKYICTATARPCPD